MNAAEIALVMGEAAPLLAGGVIQRVDQPGPLSLCLAVRRPGRTALLFCSADPDFSRLHLVPKRVRGDAPRRFGQCLRKHLVGARIVEARQVPGDRIVELSLEGPDRVDRLVLELIGRQANMIAVDAQGTIADALRHVRGTRRVVLPAKPYDPPPALTQAKAVEAPEEAVAAESPSEHFRKLYERLEHGRSLDRHRAQLRARLRRSRKRLEGLVRRAQASAGAAERAVSLRREGELLKANLYRVKEQDEAVTVQDFFRDDSPEVTIQLDPRFAPATDVERRFRRAKKLERTAAEAERRADDARGKLAAVEDADALIGEAESPEALDAIEKDLKALDTGKARGRSAQGSGGPRRFVSADGWEIMVGRNAEENDRLTLRWARGNDLWLHARNVKASHVVVPAPKGQTVPADTLVDAATLAAFYSDARGRPRVEVDYTQAKYVRKPRRSPPGTVTLTQHKTLDLRVEQARLDRLLKRD